MLPSKTLHRKQSFPGEHYLLCQSLWRRCFPVNFAKFLKTPLLQNTSGQLLLELKQNIKDLKIILIVKRMKKVFSTGIVVDTKLFLHLFMNVFLMKKNKNYCRYGRDKIVCHYCNSFKVLNMQNYMFPKVLKVRFISPADISKFQKQPFRGVLRKRCYRNMQGIYRRTPMSKCDFNKSNFIEITLWRAASEISIH